jgi:periplasmic divalent cation tolerance protein
VPGLASVYRWKGAIERSPEWLLVIKSRRGLFERLRAEIEKLHSYEVPEIVALQIVDGAEAYLNWLDRETAAG